MTGPAHMPTPSTPPPSSEPVLAARRHPVVAEVARRLEGRCGVPTGARLLVAVSGGPDSVALLLAAVTLRGRRRPWIGAALEPTAVHVNHHLRPDADEDEAFVVELAGRYRVPLEIRHVEPKARPRGLAADARRLRYAALTGAAAKLDARYVAVAHHADDQLETMLMALGRGAGLEGLSAMAWTRPLGDAAHLVRPMLGLHKRDAEDLCRAAGEPWRVDPSNLDPASARVRLRHEVLPVLEALWPDAALRAAHTADVLAAAGATLELGLADLFGEAASRTWDRTALRRSIGTAGSRAAAEAIIAAGLRRAALTARPGCADELGQAHLLPAAEAVLDGEPRPRKFDWPCGMRLVVSAWKVSLNLADDP